MMLSGWWHQPAVATQQKHFLLTVKHLIVSHFACWATNAAPSTTDRLFDTLLVLCLCCLWKFPLFGLIGSTVRCERFSFPSARPRSSTFWLVNNSNANVSVFERQWFHQHLAGAAAQRLGIMLSFVQCLNNIMLSCFKRITANSKERERARETWSGSQSLCPFYLINLWSHLVLVSLSLSFYSSQSHTLNTQWDFLTEIHSFVWLLCSSGRD